MAEDVKLKIDSIMVMISVFNQCSKLVASRDKQVNMAARDSDDALVCCVKNTVEDRIMDSGASFHATYCKEELERFKLRSGLKRRLILVGQLDEEGYHVEFEYQQRKVTKGSSVVARGNKRGSLYMVEVHPEEIGAIINGSGCGTKDLKAMALHLLHQYEDPATMILLSKAATGFANGIVMLKMVPETPLQFGVTERLSRTFRAESTGRRAEALKMLWADSVSTSYLIYRIPYVPIGFRIPEKEWRGKDTSLAHLKVKDVARDKLDAKSVKCTFIGYGSYEMGYRFWDSKSHKVVRSRDATFNENSLYGAKAATDSSNLTKPNQKDQVVLEDSPENLANKSIVTKHGLSSEITQSLVGSSDASEGSKNSGSFEDSGRSDEEDSEDRASSEEGGSETPYKEFVQWKKAINEEMVSLEKNQTWSLVRLPARKKALQSKWVFKKQRVDYNEIFSPVVKMTTIKLVLSIVAAENLHLEQLDVKTTFLHGELDEDIYMTQPEDYQQERRQHKACGWSGLKKRMKRHKARLVVKGFQQIHRVDYNEIFSPVVKMTTIRLVLSIVAFEHLHLEQLDVKTTFLHGNLDEYIYMTQPEGFQSAGKEENLVCKLKKSLYGLKQAPRLRYLKFDSFMQRAGYKRCDMDHCCYLKKVGSSSMKDRCSEKQVLGYVLTVGVTTIEWESRLQKSITIWAKLVRVLISEWSLSLLKILGTKSIAEMITRLVMKEKLKLCAASTGLRDN
ncbi:retrovirus-related pol polyprotein from transposon TNT 1-94 [Tanacetum coccineum]